MDRLGSGNALLSVEFLTLCIWRGMLGLLFLKTFDWGRKLLDVTLSRVFHGLLVSVHFWEDTNLQVSLR